MGVPRGRREPHLVTSSSTIGSFFCVTHTSAGRRKLSCSTLLGVPSATAGALMVNQASNFKDIIGQTTVGNATGLPIHARCSLTKAFGPLPRIHFRRRQQDACVCLTCMTHDSTLSLNVGAWIRDCFVGACADCRTSVTNTSNCAKCGFLPEPPTPAGYIVGQSVRWT